MRECVSSVGNDTVYHEIFASVNFDKSHEMFSINVIQVGTIWVNCWLVRDLNVPFGGAKMSGIGREGLKDSLEFYTEVKTVCIKH